MTLRTNILLIITIILMGCKSQTDIDEKPITDTLSFITSKVWNVDFSKIDSLIDFNHEPLYFKDTSLYLHNDKIGKIEYKNDTLIVRESYYLHIGDSLIKKEKLKLLARVITLNKDSLVIEKIKENRFFFYNEYTRQTLPNLSIVKFYNDTINFRTKKIFNRICFSTSTCYGECPAIAIDLDSDGNYHFQGVKYSDLIGNYYGQTSPKYVDTICFLLNAATQIKPINLSNVVPVDAQYCEFKVCFDNDTLFITGDPFDFPIRLKQLFLKIRESYKYMELIEMDSVFDFLTVCHKPAPPPPPPPPFNWD